MGNQQVMKWNNGLCDGWELFKDYFVNMFCDISILPLAHFFYFGFIFLSPGDTFLPVLYMVFLDGMCFIFFCEQFISLSVSFLHNLRLLFGNNLSINKQYVTVWYVRHF